MYVASEIWKSTLFFEQTSYELKNFSRKYHSHIIGRGVLVSVYPFYLHIPSSYQLPSYILPHVRERTDLSIFIVLFKTVFSGPCKKEACSNIF